MEKQTKLKTVFKVKEGDEEVEYAVRRPTPKEMADGQKIHNRAFKEAVDADAIIRPKLEEVLRKQNLWDDEKKAQQEKLNAEILEYERLLGRGYRLEKNAAGQQVKVALKLSEAREVAIKLRNLRWEIRELVAVKTQLDGMTAEAQADNARFNFWVSKCLVYNQGEKAGQPVFKDVDDYLEHAGEQRAYVGAGHLMSLLVGGSDPDWEKKLPENKFLLKYGFADQKLRLVDKAGRLIDSEGRLINEDGRYVNEKGEFITKNGERINEDGEFVFEDAVEFEDDLGVAPKPEPEGKDNTVEDTTGRAPASEEVAA